MYLENSNPFIRSCDLKLIARAEEIDRDATKDAGALGFMARMLVQATMPHRDPKSNEFSRRNGKFILVMNSPSEIGLPYGSIPRLILAWISTEVVRTKQPVVALGGNLSAFMRQLNMSPTGGKWGSITRLKDQLQRLFSTSISCCYEGSEQWKNVGFRIFDEAHLWWQPKRPDQLDLWQSRVILGSRFYNELIEHPVPIDMRALRALSKSPLALDLYGWITYRMSYIRKETIVPWTALSAQFGSDYGRKDNFKVAFLIALRKVLTVYYAANAKPTIHGLYLKPSRTHVARGQLR